MAILQPLLKKAKSGCNMAAILLKTRDVWPRVQSVKRVGEEH